MRWHRSFLAAVGQRLQQLGLRACPVCGSPMVPTSVSLRARQELAQRADVVEYPEASAMCGYD